MTRTAILMVTILAIGVTMLGGCGGAGETPNPRVPVILISIDTLRSSNVTSYGHERPTTPNLDRFAEESLVFREAICNSNNTLISHMSMLTSLYPTVHGAEPGAALADGHGTLAEAFRDGGYDTAFFAAHGDWLVPKYGFDRGFETFESQYVKAPQINRWVTDWLATEHADPFFLFVHYYDVHSDFSAEGPLPYNTSEEFQGTFTSGYAGEFDGCNPDGSVCASAYLQKLTDDRQQLPPADRDYIEGLYDEGILYADKMVGELLDHLRETGLYDRSIIVITADHGEAFQEYGDFLHGSIQEPVLRVPLWIRYPSSKKTGEVAGLAESVDLGPTLLEAVGIDVPERMQGESLMSLVEGGERETKFAIINRMAMRSDRWKVLPKGKGRLALYDIRNDPGQMNDLSAEHPEVIEEMKDELRDWMSSHVEMANFFGVRANRKPTNKVEIDEAERRRLEALGYKLPDSTSTGEGQSSDDPVDDASGGDDGNGNGDGDGNGDGSSKD